MAPGVAEMITKSVKPLRKGGDGIIDFHFEVFLINNGSDDGIGQFLR